MIHNIHERNFQIEVLCSDKDFEANSKWHLLKAFWVVLWHKPMTHFIGLWFFEFWQFIFLSMKKVIKCLMKCIDVLKRKLESYEEKLAIKEWESYLFAESLLYKYPYWNPLSVTSASNSLEEGLVCDALSSARSAAPGIESNLSSSPLGARWVTS